MMKKLLIALNILASASCIVLAYSLIVHPYLTMRLYKEQYQESMFKCDQAMREHLIAKNRVINDPSASSIEKLKSSEIGLIDCHDYDKLRKQLLVTGISESQLSLIGLETIELRNKDVREFVRTHEFRY